MNAAVTIRSDLDLRLEHELQTAMRRQRLARPQFRPADGLARHGSKSLVALGRGVAHEAPAVLVLKRHPYRLRRHGAEWYCDHGAGAV